MRGLRRNQIPLIIYIQMTSVIRYSRRVISGTKHPRIWVPPTQLQKLSENFKIELPWNGSKIFISLESALFTESIPCFLNRKIAPTKKLCRFLIPEFNLDIENGPFWEPEATKIVVLKKRKILRTSRSSCNHNVIQKICI